MVANILNFCAQVLTSKLDKAFINFMPDVPHDPILTSMYPNSNRRMFVPTPLSFVPLARAGNYNQTMVGLTQTTS